MVLTHEESATWPFQVILRPSLSQILAEQFTAEERQYFEHILRPIVEAGQSISTDGVAYLQAKKPGG